MSDLAKRARDWWLRGDPTRPDFVESLTALLESVAAEAAPKIDATHEKAALAWLGPDWGDLAAAESLAALLAASEAQVVYRICTLLEAYETRLRQIVDREGDSKMRARLGVYEGMAQDIRDGKWAHRSRTS
jgi:hypothetical protein